MLLSLLLLIYIYSVRRESVDHHQIKVLLDSGAPTSIVSKKIVEQLQLTIHPASALAVCGAINGASEKTSQAVTIPFIYIISGIMWTRMLW